MIKVTVGNTVKRDTVLVDETTTLREVLENAGVEYSTGVTHLDGSSLQAGDLDKTFADFNITEKCFLMSVTKVNNA